MWTFGVVDDVEVVLAEVGRDDLGHERLDLGDGQRLRRSGSIDTAPAVTPAPQPMTSDLLRLFRHQRRQVAEHPLQAHVLRLARGLHLAGVVIVQHAVGQRETATDAFQPSPM